MFNFWLFTPLGLWDLVVPDQDGAYAPTAEAILESQPLTTREFPAAQFIE